MIRWQPGWMRSWPSHGYAREGNYYRTAQGNTDTVALFCHFGVECVMLSHLLHISPMPLWRTVPVHCPVP